MSFVRFLSRLPATETQSGCQRERKCPGLLAKQPRDRLRRLEWSVVKTRHGPPRFIKPRPQRNSSQSRPIPHRDERRARWPKGEMSKRSRNISAADWASKHWCAGRKITRVAHPKVTTRRSRPEPIVKHGRVQ